MKTISKLGNAWVSDVNTPILLFIVLTYLRSRSLLLKTCYHMIPTDEIVKFLATAGYSYVLPGSWQITSNASFPIYLNFLLVIHKKPKEKRAINLSIREVALYIMA